MVAILAMVGATLLALLVANPIFTGLAALVLVGMMGYEALLVVRRICGPTREPRWPLTVLERAIFASLLSGALLIAIALVLNLVNSLTRASWLWSIWIVVASELGIVEFFGSRHSIEPAAAKVERVVAEPQDAPSPKMLSMTMTAVTIVVVLLLGSAAVVISLDSATTHDRESFTQLWLVPSMVQPASTLGAAQLGVANDEGHATSYVLTLAVPRTGALLSVRPLHLSSGQKWVIPVRYDGANGIKATLITIGTYGTQQVEIKPTS